MNKNVLATTVIAGSIFASPLFASNMFHKFMLDKQSIQPTSNAHAQAPVKHKVENYADFSGNWSGTCVFGDMEMSIGVNIENDDTHFKMDGEELSIGPLHTRTESDNMGAGFTHTSLEWNEDMSALTMKDLSFGREHSSYPYNSSNPMTTFITQMTFSLSNEQLIIKGQTIFFMDMVAQRGSEGITTCTFNKKSV